MNGFDVELGLDRFVSSLGYSRPRSSLDPLQTEYACFVKKEYKVKVNQTSVWVYWKSQLVENTQ